MMKIRIIKGHLQYVRSTLQGTYQLLREIMETRMGEKHTKWAKMIRAYLDTVNLKASSLRSMKKVNRRRSCPPTAPSAR